MSKELIKRLTEEKNLILANEEFSKKMNEIMEAKLHEYKKAVSARVFGVIEEQKVTLGRERKALITKRSGRKPQSTEIDPKKDSGILSAVGKDLKKAKKLTPDQMRAAMDKVAAKQANKRHNKEVDKQVAKASADHEAKKASIEAGHQEMLANIEHAKKAVAADASRKEMEGHIENAKKAAARDAEYKRNIEGMKAVGKAQEKIQAAGERPRVPKDLAPQEKTKGLLSKIGSKLADKFGKLFKEEEITELQNDAITAAIKRLEEAKKITLADLRKMPAMTPKEREEANIGRYRKWDKIKADAEKDREEARKAAKKKD